MLIRAAESIRQQGIRRSVLSVHVRILLKAKCPSQLPVAWTYMQDARSNSLQDWLIFLAL